LHETEEETDINQDWQNLKQAILEAAREFKLHWSTKILAHEEKCLFLVYFWTLNSIIFPEFLYHAQLSLQVKGLESSASEHEGVFLPWVP